MTSAGRACVMALQCQGHLPSPCSRPDSPPPQGLCLVLVGILMLLEASLPLDEHGSPLRPGEAFVPAFPGPWEWKARPRPSATLLHAFGSAAGMQQLSRFLNCFQLCVIVVFPTESLSSL